MTARLSFLATKALVKIDNPVHCDSGDREVHYGASILNGSACDNSTQLNIALIIEYFIHHTCTNDDDSCRVSLLQGCAARAQ